MPEPEENGDIREPHQGSQGHSNDSTPGELRFLNLRVQLFVTFPACVDLHRQSQHWKGVYISSLWGKELELDIL